MTALVVEEGLAESVAGAPPLVVVRRDCRARGRGWATLCPEAVVDALEAAGAGAVVLARAPLADAGARALPQVARLMGREVVRLPDDPDGAAWAVAMAVAWGREDRLACRLQVLVGAAGGVPTLPRRSIGGRARVPALRPRVLARWAGCVWRPCGSCGGGGLPGAPCGRCGAGILGAGA